MQTIPKSLLHDLGVVSPEQEWEAFERAQEAALESVRWLTRNAMENDPGEHRTGCVTSILKAVAEVLINERGWSSREAAEAMVMEGVRAGGNLEAREHEKRRKAWEARQSPKTAVTK